MITARLRGGLGNQMFQYAVAHHLALKHESEVALDLSWFEDQSPRAMQRSYELCVFALDRDVTKRTHPPARRRSVFPWRRSLREPIVKESEYTFNENVLNLPDNVWLHGYWHSERYFANIEPEIRRQFTFCVPPDSRNGALRDEIQQSNAVSLHVRRGDYRNSKTLAPAPVEYYREAVSRLVAEVPSPRFYVFSDEPEWSREHIRIGHPTTYISHNLGSASFEDMRLMSHCRHHIIANSSFSWWGAWLGADDGSTVIAPRTWFADASRDTSDLLPEGWVTV